MGIKIITDGSADLPGELIEQWGIEVVPLHVSFGNEVFDLKQGNQAFYRAMKEHSVLPQTASPSPYDFLQAMEKHPTHDLLVITISSNLSSTFQHAVLAKEMLETNGYRGTCHVLDSKTASLGLGLLVYRAAKASSQAASIDELASSMRTCIEGARTYFSLETLENVIKGGRLDRTKGAIASVLNIKLVMQASQEGFVEVVEKVRGTPKALTRLVEKLEEIKDQLGDKILGIAHSNCDERAVEFMQRVLKDYPFHEVVFSEMGPVIGTYAGEGGVLLTFS
jgi:DegV family protein with EDD domain